MPTTRTLAGLALACLAAVSIGEAAANRNPALATYRSMQGISYEFGSKRAIGYYLSKDGACQLTLMLAEAVDPDVSEATSAARLRLSMMPGQSAGLGSEEGESIVLTCGSGAQTMSVERAPAQRLSSRMVEAAPQR